MDNQDKIFNKIKNAADKAEEKDFPGMERIWERIDSKLEQKELQTKSKTWKKIAIAASVVLLISLGYQFLKPIAINSTNTEENVVIQEKQAPITKPSENKIHENTTVPEKPIEQQNPVAVSERSSAATNANDIANTEKSEAIVVEEKNSGAKITSSYDAVKRTISGIVLDEKGIPIPGANVYIEGSKNSASTDFDGKYSIHAEKGDQLVFSYIGYKTSYAAVGVSDQMNMKLASDSMAMNEVVVVGYGTSKKSDLTGAVASVSGADLKKVSTKDVAQSLTGRAAAEKTAETAKTKREKEIILKNKTATFRNQIFDARVVKSAYTKTEAKERKDSIIIPKKTVETNGPLIVVNGRATNAQYKSVQEANKYMPKQLDGEDLESVIILNEPLYIINGVEYTEKSLFGSKPTSPYAPLSKQNIETFEILQDEDAVEQFGKKGSKGVVIITTKNGVPSRK